MASLSSFVDGEIRRGGAETKLVAGQPRADEKNGCLK